MSKTYTHYPEIYAYITTQGTAIPSTALCAECLHRHEGKAYAAASYERDWDGHPMVDCTGNDELACIVCGSAPMGLPILDESRCARCKKEIVLVDRGRHPAFSLATLGRVWMATSLDLKTYPHTCKGTPTGVGHMPAVRESDLRSIRPQLDRIIKETS